MGENVKTGKRIRFKGIYSFNHTDREQMMFYFVRAEKYGGRHLEQIYYPGEEHQMHCWMEVLAEYGWVVTMRVMNRNQK